MLIRNVEGRVNDIAIAIADLIGEYNVCALFVYLLQNTLNAYKSISVIIIIIIIIIVRVRFVG